MSIKRTLGGDRLGSGNKMKQELHGYGRSTHDLSRTWRSTMQVGLVTPCFKQEAINGDTFEIKINHKLLTAPTNGATFGRFSVRIDMFIAALRLYNGLLHNNAVKVGMEMGKIKFPVIELKSQYITPKLCRDYWDGGSTESLDVTEPIDCDFDQHQIASNSLLAYLGTKGVGRPREAVEQTSWENNIQYWAERQINAIPELMYFDTYKNYYANQQEQQGYVVMPTGTAAQSYSVKNINYAAYNRGDLYTKKYNPSAWNGNWKEFQGGTNKTINKNTGVNLRWDLNNNGAQSTLAYSYWIRILEGNEYIVNNNLNQIQLVIKAPTTSTTNMTINLKDAVLDWMWDSENHFCFRIAGNKIGAATGTSTGNNMFTLLSLNIITSYKSNVGGVKLQWFPLANIDEMRRYLLQQQKGAAQIINAAPVQLPYNSCYETYTNQLTGGTSLYALQDYVGLCACCYKSDIFNNWLSEEWIAGTNGISAITNINVADGVLNLDVLNIMQKTYNVLNRIAVAGGTYEDWQEAVYGVEAIRRAESPVYIGGQSSELIFDEVISTGGEDALGTIAGRGQTYNVKGGNIYVKADEPSLIMGMCTIVPYIDYSQGNWWFNEIVSMDDLHKPGYDRIGFQNLPTSQMAWWDMQVGQKALSPNGAVFDIKKFSAGKQPSWIHYQTAVDECFGGFAEANNMMYMTLNRRYKAALYDPVGDESILEDLTTYIEPGKYNYIFADTTLEAQNFWMQIHFDVKARRIMSADQIPNL